MCAFRRQHQRRNEQVGRDGVFELEKSKFEIKAGCQIT